MAERASRGLHPRRSRADDAVGRAGTARRLGDGRRARPRPRPLRDNARGPPRHGAAGRRRPDRARRPGARPRGAHDVAPRGNPRSGPAVAGRAPRSEEHTSELQSHSDLVCRLLLEKKKKKIIRFLLLKKKKTKIHKNKNK